MNTRQFLAGLSITNEILKIGKNLCLDLFIVSIFHRSSEATQSSNFLFDV